MIDTDTSLFGLIGNPVAHSLSPKMHNQALAATGYNGVYLAFRVTDPGAAITGIAALNFKGISVTLPHKVAVMDYLDEVDEAAARIGAVNTIVNSRGRLIGYNTDCPGALEALRTRTSIRDKSVAIVGAGGAARAIGFGLVSAGAQVTILNRTRVSGERLAADREIAQNDVPVLGRPKLADRHVLGPLAEDGNARRQRRIDRLQHQVGLLRRRQVWTADGHHVGVAIVLAHAVEQAGGNAAVVIEEVQHVAARLCGGLIPLQGRVPASYK